tara:strand:- start:80 stop:304 length:225 start_codon:yes stop_codon:yes gene_type:complete
MSTKEDTVTITVTRFQAEFLFDAIGRKERLFSTDGVHPYFHEPYIQKRAQFRDLVRQLHRALKQLGAFNLANYS